MEKRIQKIISECGISSRRNAEELIIEGKVKVNGEIAKIGQKADLDKDEIIVKGVKLKNIEKVYLAVNKPIGFVTSTKDAHEKTIMEVIPDKYVKMGIYPVGRLDKYTEGLIFMTNDGDFANSLMHPRFKVEKRYEGICSGIVSKDEIKKLQGGIKLEEGLAKGRVFITPNGDSSYFVIKIQTGWNRQVRRMFEAIGHTVQKLRRTNIGTYSIEALGKRQTKELSKTEVNALLESVKVNKVIPEKTTFEEPAEEDEENDSPAKRAFIKPHSKKPEKISRKDKERVSMPWPREGEERKYRLDWTEKSAFEDKKKVIPFKGFTGSANRTGRSYGRDAPRNDSRSFSRSESKPTYGRTETKNYSKPYNRDGPRGAPRPYGRAEGREDRRSFGRTERSESRTEVRRDAKPYVRNDSRRPFERSENRESRPYNRDGPRRESRPYGRPESRGEHRSDSRFPGRNAPRTGPRSYDKTDKNEVRPFDPNKPAKKSYYEKSGRDDKDRKFRRRPSR